MIVSRYPRAAASQKNMSDPAWCHFQLCRGGHQACCLAGTPLAGEQHTHFGEDGNRWEDGPIEGAVTQRLG